MKRLSGNMKARIPESWKENTEYSFRFHSYNNMDDDVKYKERWWICDKNGIAWTCCENDVNLDISIIISHTLFYDMSLDDLISLCISHEIIHSILTRLVNDEASEMFDNICSRKNRNFKSWIGGMA